MAIVLNSKNTNLINQTPVLGRVYSGGTQPAVKGAFIYKNSQHTQIYPPILPVSLTQYNVYTDISVSFTNYTPIAITVSYDIYPIGINPYTYNSMYALRITWRSDIAMPTSMTLNFFVALNLIEYNGYNTWSSTETVHSSVTIASGARWTDWYSTSDIDTEEYSIDSVEYASFGLNGSVQDKYYIYNDTYYIYIDGEVTPPGPSTSITGSTSYVYFTAYMNKLPTYVSYTGNIYSQQNLFNLTYSTNSSYNYYNSYSTLQYPSSANYCYMNIDALPFNYTIPFANVQGYSNGSITKELYMKNLPFKCPTIGYTYTYASYYVEQSKFGYYFSGYFSINTDIVPFDGDPMIDSSYTLFDYNSSTKVTRYKISQPYTKIGWITERIPTKYSMEENDGDPFLLYPWSHKYIGTSTKEINNGYRYIYLSTSSSLTLKITSEGNYADIDTGTFYINSGYSHTATENFGWTSGGATTHYNATRYLLHGVDGASSASYPCWTLYRSISSWEWNDTSHAYSLYVNYGDGTATKAQSLLNYIYGSLTVTLHVEDRTTSNNFTWTDSGYTAYMNLDYTYRHTPVTVYVYEIGNSSASTKKVTFSAKQLGSFTFYWNVSECQYVIRDFKQN